jgi:regulator of PEP synthase PpsR (kinase-PPPase family)
MTPESTRAAVKCVRVSTHDVSTVELHVVSDATGETATRVVAAVEAQFPDQAFETVRHPRAETVADLQLALERMKGKRAVVIFTIVDTTLRAAMRKLCSRARVDYCDLLAQPLEAVAKVTGRAARMKAGARPALDEQYFRRIAAIEFAVKQDDGLGGNLKRADVVLCGVSRTSKTPLSIYLGFLGWKAANIPLVHGIDPPAQLFEVDPAKVVGLTIAAERLAEIRSERVHAMGGDRRYASLEEIYEDLEFAAGIHRRIGCPVIDVSELSIEEIALRITRHVEQRTKR